MIEGKRIAMIGWAKPYHVGGISSHIDAITKILAKNNKMYIITVGDRPLILNDKSVTIYQERLTMTRRFKAINTSLKMLKRAYILRKNVDVFHAHRFPSSLIGLIDTKTPLVLTYHGYPTLELVSTGRIKPNSIQFKFMRWIEQKAVERADAVIAVGNTIRKWLINDLGAEPNKVFYIPNGVDSEIFTPYGGEKLDMIKSVKDKYNLNNYKIILFVKHFTPFNGIQYLLPAIKGVLKEYKNIKLVMTNEDVHLLPTKELGKKLGIENNLVFTGRVSSEELIALYNASDIFCIPYISPLSNRCMFGVGDTLGISHLEAMACGKPVIGTKVGLKKDFEKELGDSILVVPPKNSIAIADAILYLLESPEEAREMGKRARELVLEKYIWDKIVEQITNIYEFAIEKRGK